jgi:cyclopropane fatty-acyl-phospholipid synthase-like methyltransferase
LQEYSEYKLKTGFIQKYIFPGCCIPAVRRRPDLAMNTLTAVR